MTEEPIILWQRFDSRCGRRLVLCDTYLRYETAGQRDINGKPLWDHSGVCGALNTNEELREWLTSLPTSIDPDPLKGSTTDWRSMDSAPKDGTTILVIGTSWRVPSVASWHYCDRYCDWVMEYGSRPRILDTLVAWMPIPEYGGA